ncbi:MAG: prepilin-type N-terminal cleavage/methylation domain-containing protein [Sedimentibacter sp.]|uniref:PilW family protein n=1 Tax=Sedimentibacter sp. TaxID=1960295 RepID=UPI002981D825|nr:prepilin-type N-terminal cleavage/methylation domain-containing protein [Sedimentibacter sp.]MDW5300393.1 prepilin-type N-terminal cleavage/methylation domain-containing protein [Sedimentibacter sp.]
MKNNRKGLTLIELLVALGLSTMIIFLVISFFITNLKNYKSINNESELQFQAQYILNFMTNKIMESENISLLRKDDLNMYSISYIRPVGVELISNKISFKYGELSSENYVFHITNNNIRYGRGDKDIKPTVELGSYIKYMYVSLLKESSLSNAKILRIRIIFEKDNEDYEAEQVVYMRNN